jgi:hypothetical protein
VAESWDRQQETYMPSRGRASIPTAARSSRPTYPVHNRQTCCRGATLGSRLERWQQARRESRWAAGVALSWDAWWERVAKDPVLGPLVREREKIFAARCVDQRVGEMAATQVGIGIGPAVPKIP